VDYLSKQRRLNQLFRNGKAVFLAYDQGLEHGPTDFNEKNADPALIMNLAQKAHYTAVIFQRGTAEKYYDKHSGIPLILKLNGKTSLSKGEPYSPSICTVEEAVRLGATAVGYTLYPGSEHEDLMFKEWAVIKKAADEYGLPTVMWVYPRGKNVKKPDSPEMIAYAARIGLELGADIIKIREPKDLSKLAWAARVAGTARIVVAGGSKVPEQKFLANVRTIMQTGVNGLAVGRNIWQQEAPLEMSFKVMDAVFR